MSAELPDLTPPEPTAGDKTIAAVHVVLSAVPVLGGPAAELLAAVVTPPIQRRRDEWMRGIAEALVRFDVVARRLDNLGDDEVFVSALLQASHAALRTHQREKLEALRNAVLNAALPTRPDETLQQLFVALVDDLTVWHLQTPATPARPGSRRRGARASSRRPQQRLDGDGD